MRFGEDNRLICGRLYSMRNNKKGSTMSKVSKYIQSKRSGSQTISAGLKTQSTGLDKMYEMPNSTSIHIQ